MKRALLKQVALLLLVTVLATLCLSGCGPKPSPSPEETSSEESVEPAGNDEATEEEAEEEEVEPTPTIENVDSSILPEELLSLLYAFNYGQLIIHEGGSTTRDFDCTDKSTYEGFLAKSITLKPSCSTLWLYPVEQPEEVWEPSADPLKTFEMGYYRIPRATVLWTLENVFNVPTQDANELIDKMVSEPNSDIWSYVYEHDDNGTSNLYCANPGIGGVFYSIAFEEVRYDGAHYHLVYDLCDPWSSDSKVYYAEVEQKDIDGQKVWSLYRHSKDTSLLPELTVEIDEDIFAKFSGTYGFGSGVGAWGTSLEINSDGTFTGEFHDSNMGETGDGYDSILYYSDFKGRFSNPKRINEYTYSFELEEIQYENEPNTEEIVTTEDGHRLLMKYWDAYGLNEGTKTIIAYTERAPLAMLPEEFLLWVGMSTEMNYMSEDQTLGRRGLFTVESKYGWLGGSKE